MMLEATQDPHSAANDAHVPFQGFVDGPLLRDPLRQAITAAWRQPEPEAVVALLAQARLPKEPTEAAHQIALGLTRQLRTRENRLDRASIVQGLLQEYALSSREGVALMCLAEALLRIPDAATRDALIRDKIAQGNWSKHLGRSTSLFVNAASWGLLLTGKLVTTHSEEGLTSMLSSLVRKGGEPLIRKGVDMAMRMMGEQFVTGETIEAALKNAARQEKQGFSYSYDMLGEAALTQEDADRYRTAYEHAIHAIGQAAAGRGIYAGPGISIKLSALHPRYSRAQYTRVMAELYPALLRLTLLAKRYGIGLNIDAEETDRLELSLDLLEKLCLEPDLVGFDGIGFVVQAYQKRCPHVLDWLIDLAQRSQHRLMVRLVKGAYWDSEIKRAQIDGQEGYPVYTRKSHTDLSYLACAKKLLAHPETIYPQFATHNAHTLATIYQEAGPDRYTPGQYEFQCLHGMGEPLYEQVVGSSGLDRPCRIYAPVGTHETLLAYLVRRLLENGANSSFINRIADPSIPIEALVEDPVSAVERMARREGQIGLAHPAIPLPEALYGKRRLNSAGLDLANEHTLQFLDQTLRESSSRPWKASPMLGTDQTRFSDAEPKSAFNPADHCDVVGEVRYADETDVETALGLASAAAPGWAAVAPVVRAETLERAADLMQDALPPLVGLLIREAGKTASNAIAEVREACDFLRYYAAQVRADFDPGIHRPLGPVVCISPWNFPLAIFTGQLAAALAAGNPVLAKPAEQTSLVAAEAVRLLWQAGVPRSVLQLLPGRGSVIGRLLVQDDRCQGVLFTGSTEVARLLQGYVAGRLNDAGQPVTLIAETGGQNAMVVDSSALPEQVVLDILTSAFDSAGQRCSALRVLCLQEDIADHMVGMIKGAMAELRVGRPDALATDVGPVIDARARDTIAAHISMMRAKGHRVHQPAHDPVGAAPSGTFVVPTMIELDSIAELEREIFGPVLHVVRFKRDSLSDMIAQINATGYGLTLGIHTRIDETIAQVVAGGHAGNLYVNRNMVGAVVGVQPFGGEGLSGTGPKAGGPLYLYRLLARRPEDAMHRALAWSTPEEAATTPLSPPPLDDAMLALQQWADSAGHGNLSRLCRHYAQLSCAGMVCPLAGPTGEHNAYRLLPRQAVLCLAGNEPDLLSQLAAVLAVKSRAIWTADAAKLLARLPEPVRARIEMVEDWRAPAVSFDTVLHHGDSEALKSVCRHLVNRPGPIVNVHGMPVGDTAIPLERLLLEHSISTNTAAAGGNASLMTLDSD